jgi:4-hydroxy-3-methylbut-2-enyl diphosphate reductase
MRQFDVPTFYSSPIISTVKDARKATDPRKKDLSPSVIDFGPLRFKIARHFGFCYGVENAIEIAYQAIDENPDKRIFLLSEMIHNPHVNDDLRERGVRFLRTTSGEQLIPFDELTEDDVVIIPAFGASTHVAEELQRIGVDTEAYDTTCPFVEKVWRKSHQIGQKDYSIVVHGKRYHEETRATISHAKEDGPVVVVRDLDEAEVLAKVIRGEESDDFFFDRFEDRYSAGFDPATDLRRLGVVNQTTMLATETKAIADLLREALIDRYGEADIETHFADTSDTLCYATYENQDATKSLINDGGDVALVVGGYNSSNTSHLVELCEEHMPTYFVKDADQIESPAFIQHFDLHAKQETTTEDWFPDTDPVDIVLTSGASCPDALLDEIVRKLVAWFPDARPIEEALAPFASDEDAAD